MKKDKLDDLADSLIRHGNPHLPKEGFDRDKWQWDDATRMNEQEKRITQLIAESNEHRKRVIEECHNNSIETRVWSHGNLGKHKFWTNRYDEFNGEVANKIYERGFIVPTHPFLNVEDIDFISEVCNGV